MKVFETTRNAAAEANFAVFNPGNHLCVKLDEEKHQTISVITQFGKRITFAFMGWKNPQDGYVECVDIKHHHNGKTDKQGNPRQMVHVEGAGPTYYVTGEDEATLTVVDLRQE